MIPIGNLCLRHLIGTLRYFTVPISKMYGLWIVDPLLPKHVCMKDYPSLLGGGWLVSCYC